MVKLKGSCLFIIQEARGDDFVGQVMTWAVFLTGPTLLRKKIAHRKGNISCHKRVTLSGALLKWMLLKKFSSWYPLYSLET